MPQGCPATEDLRDYAAEPRSSLVTGQVDVPVVVVGAGPVGSVLALELARHGVGSVLLERSTGPSRHPKMDYVSGRSMELLRRLGLAEPMRRRGIGPGHRANFLW